MYTHTNVSIKLQLPLYIDGKSALDVLHFCLKKKKIIMIIYQIKIYKVEKG